jgi:nitrogen fixation-related uncharacterized protein
MIYELMKREMGWWLLPWYVLASAVICACPAPVSEFGVMMSVMMGLFVAFPHMHATRFNATLPIAGRDLVMARALSILAMIWLPAMAGAATASMFSGRSAVAGRALIMAALCTLAAGLAQSIHVRELAAPKWTFFAPWVFIPITGVYLEQHGARFLIPASCALAGIALLARTWSVAPKSFELVPAKPRGGDGRARPAFQTGVASPRFVWLPVLRSVFTVPYSMLLAFLVFFGFGGQRLALSFWILVVWVMARLGTLWLRPLPIRARALLIAMAGPILLALAGGYFGGLHLGRDSEPIPVLRVQVLDLGALLGWALVVVLVYALVDWRQLSHIPRKVRISVFVVLMVGATLGGIVSGPRGVDPLHLAVLRLAQALPNSVGVAVVLVAATLAALWLALEKVFAEADCVGRPRPQKDEYFG